MIFIDCCIEKIDSVFGYFIVELRVSMNCKNSFLAPVQIRSISSMYLEYDLQRFDMSGETISNSHFAQHVFTDRSVFYEHLVCNIPVDHVIVAI